MNSIVSSVTEQLLAATGRSGSKAVEEDPLAVLAGFGSTLRPVQHAQKLLLSATLSCDPEKLDALNLHNPVLFTTPAADPRESPGREGPSSDHILAIFVAVICNK